MKNKSWLRWIPGLMVMAVIFVASSTPASQIHNFGSWDLLVKKGGHFLAYAALGSAYLYALGDQRAIAWFTAWILAVAYASSDELHQIFTSGRHSSPVDVVIDSLGAIVGILLFRYFLEQGRLKGSDKAKGHEI